MYRPIYRSTYPWAYVYLLLLKDGFIVIVKLFSFSKQYLVGGLLHCLFVILRFGISITNSNHCWLIFHWGYFWLPGKICAYIYIYSLYIGIIRCYESNLTVTLESSTVSIFIFFYINFLINIFSLKKSERLTNSNIFVRLCVLWYIVLIKQAME